MSDLQIYAYKDDIWVLKWSCYKFKDTHVDYKNKILK